jgi:hypothetical protein
MQVFNLFSLDECFIFKLQPFEMGGDSIRLFIMFSICQNCTTSVKVRFQWTLFMTLCRLLQG